MTFGRWLACAVAVWVAGEVVGKLLGGFWSIPFACPLMGLFLQEVWRSTKVEVGA